MKHVDMRKLPAAAQEERRRQVIGLRQAGQTYDAIAAQVGLSPTGVFDICKRFAERGPAGLKTGPRGPEPGHGRFLDADQEREARDLIRCHTPLCCTSRRCGRIEPYPCPGSRGADVLRASQVQHAVQGVDGDRHLGRLSSVRLEA